MLGNKRLRLFLSFAVFAIVLCTSAVMVCRWKYPYQSLPVTVTRHIQKCPSQSYVSSIVDIYKTIAWKMALAISICRLRGGAPSPAKKALICNSFLPDYDASSFCISTPSLLHRLFTQRRVDIISVLLSPGIFH